MLHTVEDAYQKALEVEKFNKPFSFAHIGQSKSQSMSSGNNTMSNNIRSKESSLCNSLPIASPIDSKASNSSIVCHKCHHKCGTPFPSRSVLADPNRVRDALLPLNHSKSNLCGSDFNFGQAHKHLHLTKCSYSEGILCLFKLIYKIDIQSSKCFCKISKFKKKTWNECTCRSILRNFLLYDSTLLDLGSAFDHYLSLGTCALVKQYAKHFHA